MHEFHALVLAAGEGSRFGGRKLLAPWGRGISLDGALEAAFAAPVESVVPTTHDGLAGDVGVKRVLDQLGPALALIPSDDPGVHLDVDVVSDLSAVA
ncbi:NTP transferase domain-containing protein [Microvirga alba]|uniref:NTP transferase domain-containing protein n=1 Tax=Microvirga alba TaxID=2791025 RepID=A0A931FNT2_9HYPH|nr:NTP transferase domain-containing protein [Microvirga alba]MBF9232672.1 NTP transferase domain-containing protein [Microvirga alba]